jgi:hypothetical protein
MQEVQGMRRQWRATFAGGVLVVLSIAHSLSARGSDLERHNELVKTFVIEGGAYPLVADCAAHADFVMRTLPAFGGVQFPANAFDSEHSSVIPSWNERFDRSKQQVKVDTIVSVVGLAIRNSRTATPQALKFRCGYEDGGGDGMFMLAFSWSKSPLPPDWRKPQDDGVDQPENDTGAASDVIVEPLHR